MDQLKYFLKMLGWLTVFLLIVELGARLLIKSPTPYNVNDPTLGLVIEKGTLVLWGEEGYGITYYQDYGEVATPYSGGENILVLGDSNTAAWQVLQSQKFTSVAEETIRTKGIYVDLHNLGLPSATIADYFYLANGAIEKYNPSLVVIELTYFQARGAFNSNRNNHFKINQDGSIDFIHLGNIKKTDQPERVQVKYNKFCNFSTLSSTIRVICERTSNLFVDIESSEGIPNNWKDKLPDVAMELRGAYQNIPMIIILLPNAPVITKDTLKLDDAGDIVYNDLSNISDWHIIYPLPEFIATAEQGIMPRGFYNSAPGTGHINSVGHEIIGKMLASSIEDILR